MALAPIRTVVLGTFAFLIFWTLATFPAFPGLPIGRTAGAIGAAALMVIFQVESPDAAYDSVNLPILGLLFGTMVVSVYLERADMFKYLAQGLSWKCRGGKELLCRLSFLIALSSAIFTNDTCCVIFTEFILDLCREKNLPPEPFLLALASSANLGSSTTPIGNPQNLVIAIQSKIPFGKFVLGILPAMLLGVTINTGLLLGMYWKQLSGKELPVHASLGNSGKELPVNGSLGDAGAYEKNKLSLPNAADAKLSVDDSDMFQSCRSLGFVEDINHFYDLERHDHNKSTFSAGDHLTAHVNGEKVVNTFYLDAMLDPKTFHIQGNKTFPEDHMRVAHTCTCISIGSKSEREIHSLDSPRSPPTCESPLTIQREKEKNAFKRWKNKALKISVYCVTVGMLAALLAGLNLSWCTLAAAITLIVLDFTDAGPCLNKVSYSLLVFFSGMFITVDGFNKTGIPAALWKAIEPHARINHATGTIVLTAVILLLSNVASNVPTVLLLGPRVAASSGVLSGRYVTKAWLILAWASTIAGNLTLVGSAANLIVCEKARTAPAKHNLSFWRHLRFGFPSTLLIVAIGIPLIHV